MFIKDIFCQRLRALRDKQTLFQMDLANDLGVSKQTLSAWETGTREPNMAALYALADYFDVSTDYLLGRTDNPNSHKQ